MIPLSPSSPPADDREAPTRAAVWQTRWGILNPWLRRVRRWVDSIHQRLLLAFVLMSLMPLIVSAVFNSSVVWDLMEQEAINYQVEVTTLVADKISRYLQDAQTHLAMAGTHWHTLNLTPEQFTRYLQDYTHDDTFFMAIWIMDASGQELVSFQDDTLLADPELKNRSEQEVFFRPARGEAYFSPVRLVDGQPQLTLSLPLMQDNTFIGVIAAQVNISQSWDIIRTMRVGSTGYAMLVDRRGNLIVHRDELVMSSHPNLATLPPIGEVSASDDPHVTSLIYTSPFSGEVLGSALRIPGPNWILVLERSTGEAFNALIIARANLHIVIGMTLVVAIFLSVFLSRQVTYPIIQLRNAANRIRRGELSLRIPDHNRTELGELARAFNAMTAALQNQIQQIDEQNQALTVANAKAAEVSRLKDEFLAMISHELRTPMNSIVGYTGLILMDDKIALETRDFLERVDVSSQRLLMLINDILDLSRLEAGKIQLHLTDIPIRKLAAAWEAQMRVLAHEKNITLEVHIATNMPIFLRSDEEALTKIAINLLSNAIKFTEQGRVSLELERMEAYWHLRVQDTGIGIPPEMHEAIFDRFQQVDGSYKRRHGGTGLGLAIVRSMTQVMGGVIHLESIPSEGTTITVTLPLDITPEI